MICWCVDVSWLQGYLKNNPNVSAADRVVCDEVLQNDTE